MSDLESYAPQLDKIEGRSLLVGALFLVLSLVGAYLNPSQFFHSYLFAFLFWLGIAVGSTALVMLHHLVGGGWGLIVRRLLESGTRMIPLMGLLVIPVLLGIPLLYEWSHPEEVAADPLLQHKSAYLNTPFFVARTLIYFLIWMAMAYYLNKWSREQDTTGDPRIPRRFQALSGPGLILYGLTVTFASIDWAMSLEPHWFSTIYGVLFMVGQVLSTLSFVIAAAMLLVERDPLKKIATKARLQDLGNLMLAFVMLWAYIAFSQFLIIWSGNLPEEITWYTRRLRGGWAGVAVFLLVFHFAAPFLLLLSRSLKRKVHALRTVALAIILMRLVDLFWIVAPVHAGAGIALHWMDITAPVGMGGIWIAFYLKQLRKRPLLPVKDPQLMEELARG